MGCNLEKSNRKNLLELSKRGKLVPYELSIETVLGVMRNVQCALLMSLPHVKKES